VTRPRRYVISTATPAEARRSAVAAPIPWLAPVTSATGSVGRPDLVETDLAAPTPAQFSAAIRDGRLIQNSPEAQRIGGKVALRTFLEGVASPAFEEAITILRAG